MNKFRCFVLLSGFIAFFNFPLLAQSESHTSSSLDRAVDYYMGLSTEVNFFQGRDLLIQLQDEGDVLAGMFCGINYYTGSFSFPFDPTRGISLCLQYIEPVRQRAQGNDSFACMLLGMAYYYGLGVEENAVIGESWLQKAAESGGALETLQYAKVIEIRNKEEQAFELYQELKDKGCMWGDVGGGVCLLYGKGCWLDQESGYGVIQATAEKGFPPAMGWLGLCYERGYVVEKDLTAARNWYEKGLKAGDELSGGLLGNLYEAGNGVERDFSKAIEIYQQAAAIGSEDALIQQIGFYYYNKDMKNYKKAFDLAYECGKAKYLLRAYTYLGWLHLDHESPKRDYQKAFQNFYYAAQRGDSDSQMCLAGLYETGKGVEEDIKNAEFYYRLAAQGGNPTACASLAHFLFRMNIDISQGHKLAKEAYEKWSVNPGVRSAYCWSLCNQGKYEEAKGQLEEIKYLFDYNGNELPGVYYELSAMVCEGQGKKRIALELYRKALDTARERDELSKKQESDLLEAIKRLEE